MNASESLFLPKISPWQFGIIYYGQKDTIGIKVGGNVYVSSIVDSLCVDAIYVDTGVECHAHDFTQSKSTQYVTLDIYIYI